jgi:hypothetical protein
MSVIDGNLLTQCFSLASSSQMIRPPPDVLLKRLESLEAPNSNPITVYSTKMDRLKKGLSKEDAAIADRLQKLQGLSFFLEYYSSERQGIT